MGVTEWYDGFDLYSAAQITEMYDTDSSTASVQTPGRYGTGQYRSAQNGNNLNLLALGASVGARGFLSQTASKVMGVAYGMLGAPSANNQPIFQTFDGANLQMELWMDTSGHLLVKKNGTTVATSTLTLVAGLWYFIEFVVTIHPSAGIYTVIVNTTDIWISATGQNTRATSNSWIDGVRLCGSGTFSGNGIDDWYIRNDTTTLGEVRCVADEPNADGDTDDFTPNSGVTHFSRVNSNDGDTSFVSDPTVGHLELVKFPSYSSAGGQTAAVQVVHCSRKDDATNRTLKAEMKSGGTVFDGPSTGNLFSSYLYYKWIQEVDPATSAAWIDANVSAVQLGVKVNT